MRDIIFRGKLVHTTGTLTWVQGLLTKNVSGEWCIMTEGSPMLYQVDPSTVCQYTGLKDRYGNLIFEKDIIQWEPCCIPRYVDFYEGEFYIFNEHGEPVDDLSRLHDLYGVIGNIYDNPSLFG